MKDAIIEFVMGLVRDYRSRKFILVCGFAVFLVVDKIENWNINTTADGRRFGSTHKYPHNSDTYYVINIANYLDRCKRVVFKSEQPVQNRAYLHLKCKIASIGDEAVR